MTDHNDAPLKRSTFGQQHTLTLSNGEKVRVRRPSTFYLVAVGALPSELTTTVWKLFSEDGARDKLGEIMEKGNGLRDYTGLVTRFIPHVVMPPTRVVQDTVDDKGVVTRVPTDCIVGPDGVLSGILNVVDLPDLDQNTIFFFGIGVGKSDEEQAAGASSDPAVEVGPGLEQFRDGAARAVPGDDRSTVPGTAVGADRTPVDEPVGS